MFSYKKSSVFYFCIFFKTKIKKKTVSSCTRDISCESSPKISESLVHPILRYRGTRKSIRCFEKIDLQVSVLLYAHLNFLIENAHNFGTTASFLMQFSGIVVYKLKNQMRAFLKNRFFGRFYMYVTP